MPTKEKIIVNGVEREYVLHIPKNLAKNPDVIMSLHGGGSNGTEWWGRHWDRQANKGFIIVCPTAGNHQNQSDNWVGIGDDKHGPTLDLKIDEQFLLAIVDLLKIKYEVSKVFLTGFSSGAKMTHSMYLAHADKFDGFGMTGQGIREDMAAMTPPAIKPLRISYGTKDDNFANPDADIFDALETMLWYCEALGHDKAADERYRSPGIQNNAKTLVWTAAPAFEIAKVIGMTHRWAKVSMGDPFNEDDALINFFQKYAGMK